MFPFVRLQLFRRQPVLKIQVIHARHASKNNAVTPRLIHSATSAVPKKVQRKPLMRYTTGLNSVIVRHGSGRMVTE